MKTFAINGFGRIGRLTLRAWHQYHQKSLELAAINTSGSMDLAGWAHLLKYDTTYRAFSGAIGIEEHQKASEISVKDPFLGNLIIDGHKIPVLAGRDPDKIPWSKYVAETIVESTGAFTSEEGASRHLLAGAKNVVISAPGKGGNVTTSVLGVNDAVLRENTIKILSNASCTTNCVAPVAKIMVQRFGVQKATMTTIHSYTDDQNLQDGSHRDLRRARAAAQNIVPTSTGAAISTTETIKELKGIFDGVSLRVPTITGSLTDFTFLLKKRVSVELVNATIKEEAKHAVWQGILAVTEDPIVSSDVIGRRESAVVDLGLTQVIDGDLVKIMAWYDNEWGYANRLIETVASLTDD